MRFPFPVFIVLGLALLHFNLFQGFVRIILILTDGLGFSLRFELALFLTLSLPSLPPIHHGMTLLGHLNSSISAEAIQGIGAA